MSSKSGRYSWPFSKGRLRRFDKEWQPAFPVIRALPRLVARGRDDTHRGDLERAAHQHSCRGDAFADLPHWRRRIGWPEEIHRSSALLQEPCPPAAALRGAGAVGVGQTEAIFVGTDFEAA